MNQLATITDVYNEIRNALSENADYYNIEGIAKAAYVFNPDTEAFEPSTEVTFWAAVEANHN